MSVRLATYASHDKPGIGATELRLVQYDESETHDGAIRQEWEVWSGNVCVARLTQHQLDQASAWSER